MGATKIEIFDLTQASENRSAFGGKACGYRLYNNFKPIFFGNRSATLKRGG